MKLTEFEQHYQGLKTHIDKLLLNKRAEYADSEDEGDRLSNFKQVTSLFETNPAMVCMMYQSKHYASLVKICQDIDKGIYPTKEVLLEKAGDLICYSFLLYAQLVELLETHENICHVAAQEALEAPSDSKDDSKSHPKNDENFSENEDSLNFHNPYRKQLDDSDFDNSDSITKCPRVTVREALETLPLDREERKDLEQVVPVKNQLDNLNLRTIL